MTWYSSTPQNLTLNDVRNVLRETGLPYTRASIPASAVNTPLVTALPKSVEDRTQVFLMSGSSVDHYIYLKSLPGWVRLNDTVNQSIVTALPSTADEGDQIVYDTGTSGVRWHLVYDTSDGTTYPWLFIGGPALYAEVTTQQTTQSASFTDLSTTGPTVTLPLAGDFDVEVGCRAHVNTNAGFAGMSYAIGASAATDADAIFHNEPAGDNTSPQNIMRKRRKTGLTAVALTSKYRVNNAANTATFEHRWISALPVRVG